MRLIKCPMCNKGVDANTNFCPHCGYKFTNVSTVESSNNNQHDDYELLSKLKQEDVEKIKTIIDSKKNKLKIIDWIIALVVLSIIVISWIVVLSTSEKIWIALLISFISLVIIFVWLFIKIRLIQKFSKNETKKIVDSYSKK